MRKRWPRLISDQPCISWVLTPQGNGRKKIFYLTTQLWLYSVRHRVKDHPDSERNPAINHGALAGTRNSSMSPPWGIVPTTHCTMSRHSMMELPQGNLHLLIYDVLRHMFRHLPLCAPIHVVGRTLLIFSNCPYWSWLSGASVLKPSRTMSGWSCSGLSGSVDDDGVIVPEDGGEPTARNTVAPRGSERKHNIFFNDVLNDFFKLQLGTVGHRYGPEIMTEETCINHVSFYVSNTIHG